MKKEKKPAPMAQTGFGIDDGNDDDMMNTEVGTASERGLEEVEEEGFNDPEVETFDDIDDDDDLEEDEESDDEGYF
jgi:hypothetical protein